MQLWFWKLIKLYQWPLLVQGMEGGSEMVISSHGFWLTLLGQVMAFLQWCLCLFVLWLPEHRGCFWGGHCSQRLPPTAQLSKGTDICFSCCCSKPWDTHSSHFASSWCFTMPHWCPEPALTWVPSPFTKFSLGTLPGGLSTSWTEVSPRAGGLEPSRLRCHWWEVSGSKRAHRKWSMAGPAEHRVRGCWCAGQGLGARLVTMHSQKPAVWSWKQMLFHILPHCASRARTLYVLTLSYLILLWFPIFSQESHRETWA